MGMTKNDGDKGTATLHLEGVNSPIFTTVTRRGELGMTVEQALPFLKLQTRVQDGAERDARIESVSMVVYDGLPRLVLDLAYDSLPEMRAPEPFLPLEEPARRGHAGVARPRRIDETVPFALETPLAPPQADPEPVHPVVTAEEAQSPRDDSTLMFRTVPPSQMTLEERLLHAHTVSYRARVFWDDFRPRVQYLAWSVWRFCRLATERARPFALTAAKHANTVARYCLRQVRMLGIRLRDWRRDRQERKQQATASAEQQEL